MGRFVTVLVVVGLTACALAAPVARTQVGGSHLTVLSLADVDSLDPGYWYYTYDYMALGETTQRWLYALPPNATGPVPDVAAALPETSTDGRTVMIRIRPGIRYSAPLAGRTVTAADVAYAITRDLMPRTGNGYAGLYYRVIRGASGVLSGRTERLAGVETPDATTLVLHLTRRSGAISNGEALALPGTAPVPQDYAKRYDRGSTSTYGAHQVFTGPYRIQSYARDKRLELVRNPDWNGPQTGDFRPARLDAITLLSGNEQRPASREVLDGSRMVNGDFSVPSDMAGKGRISFGHSGTVRFIALNTRVRPFGNVNVRRAVAAAIDRKALAATRRGSAGNIATHLIPPTVPGYDQSGGRAGPALPFTPDPGGDLAVARSYLRRAGYRRGRYTGPPLLLAGNSELPGSRTSAAVRRQLRPLGFRFRMRLVSTSTLLSRYCGRPKATVAICPTLGWTADFFDAQGILDPMFNGANIAPSFNPNYAQVDDRRINRELAAAAALADPAARARRYAAIDRLVIGRAYVVPWYWDVQINAESADVDGVVNPLTSTWDLTFTR